MEKRKRKNHGQTSALVWRVFRSGDVCVPGHAKLWISCRFPPSSLFVFLFFSPCAAIFQRRCCGGHKQDPLTIRGEMFKILRRTHTHTHTRAHKTRAMGFGGNPLLFFFLNIPLYNIWLWRYIFSFFYDAFKVI
jgi:hypothetical protein